MGTCKVGMARINVHGLMLVMSLQYLSLADGSFSYYPVAGFGV
jgi:hypothetical protein